MVILLRKTVEIGKTCCELWMKISNAAHEVHNK